MQNPQNKHQNNNTNQKRKFAEKDVDGANRRNEYIPHQNGQQVQNYKGKNSFKSKASSNYHSENSSINSRNNAQNNPLKNFLQNNSKFSKNSSQNSLKIGKNFQSGTIDKNQHNESSQINQQINLQINPQIKPQINPQIKPQYLPINNQENQRFNTQNYSQYQQNQPNIQQKNNMKYAVRNPLPIPNNNRQNINVGQTNSIGFQPQMRNQPMNMTEQQILTNQFNQKKMQLRQSNILMPPYQPPNIYRINQPNLMIQFEQHQFTHSSKQPILSQPNQNSNFGKPNQNSNFGQAQQFQNLNQNLFTIQGQPHKMAEPQRRLSTNQKKGPVDKNHMQIKINPNHSTKKTPTIKSNFKKEKNSVTISNHFNEEMEDISLDSIEAKKDIAKGIASELNINAKEYIPSKDLELSNKKVQKDYYKRNQPSKQNRSTSSNENAIYLQNQTLKNFRVSTKSTPDFRFTNRNMQNVQNLSQNFLSNFNPNYQNNQNYSQNAQNNQNIQGLSNYIKEIGKNNIEKSDNTKNLIEKNDKIDKFDKIYGNFDLNSKKSDQNDQKIEFEKKVSSSNKSIFKGLSNDKNNANQLEKFLEKSKKAFNENKRKEDPEESKKGNYEIGEISNKVKIALEESNLEIEIVKVEAKVYSIDELNEFQSDTFFEKYFPSIKNENLKQILINPAKKISCTLKEKFWQIKRETRTYDKKGHSFGSKYNSRSINYNKFSSNYRNRPIKNVTKQSKPTTNLKKPELKKEVDEWEKFRNDINISLNKLSPQNFDKIRNSILKTIINLDTKTIKTFNIVLELVFDKALKEQSYSNIYAQLISSISKKYKLLPVLDENNKEIFLTLDKLLITKIQNVFKETNEKETDESLSVLEKKKNKQKALGNIKFAGELYKNNLIPCKIMTTAIHLILKKKSISEKGFEVVCNCLKTIGKNLDEESKQDDSVKKKLNQTYDIISKNIASLSVGRVKFMLMDIMDLRLNNWVPINSSNVKNVKQAAILKPKMGIKTNENMWKKKSLQKRFSISHNTKKDSKFAWNTKIIDAQNFKNFFENSPDVKKEAFLDFAEIFKSNINDIVSDAFYNFIDATTDMMRNTKYRITDFGPYFSIIIEHDCSYLKCFRQGLKKFLLDFENKYEDMPKLPNLIAKLFYSLMRNNLIDFTFLGDIEIKNTSGKHAVKIVENVAAIFQIEGKLNDLNSHLAKINVCDFAFPVNYAQEGKLKDELIKVGKFSAEGEFSAK